MVLSKINNHKHRTKQTYESYTFQPLMSFCCHLIRNQSKNRTFPRLYKVIKFICSALWAISPTQMTDFPTLLNISTSKIPTLSYTWSLKNVPLSGGASPYRTLKGDNLFSVSSAEEAEMLINDLETRNITKNFPTTRQAMALEAQVRSSYIIVDLIIHKVGRWPNLTLHCKMKRAKSTPKAKSAPISRGPIWNMLGRFG